MTRAERMLDLGIRTGSLPADVSHRIMRAYVDIAGGWSWDEKAHPLTDAELDKLEQLIADAERASVLDQNRDRDV
jgi:hypothetical protein